MLVRLQRLRNDLHKAVKGAKHKAYSPLDDRWVILTTSKAFDYFRARRDEIRYAFDPPYFVDKITVEDRVSDSFRYIFLKRYCTKVWRSMTSRTFQTFSEACDICNPHNMWLSSPQCYTTFWRMTINYNDTLHWSGITPIFDSITDLDLSTEFDIWPNCKTFPWNIHKWCGMTTEDAYSSGHLVLSHFGTCKCSNVETNLSWSCFRTFEFRTSIGTSVFALTLCQ